MALPQEREYTLEDIYNLPEGVRAELIDGQIFYQAAPGFIHQKILSYLNSTIYNYIKSKDGKCIVLPAPFAVFLNDNDTKYIEPDISVICDPCKITEDGCKGSPDFIIEIVSKASKRLDYYIKLFKYRSADIKEYWIVDPLDKQITVHFFEDTDSPKTYLFTDKIKVNIYNDLVIDFNELDI